MKLSQAAYRLEGQPMFQILIKTRELERQGRDILHFELGDPDFDTPWNICEAAIKALRDDDTHYAPSTGLHDLKVVAAEVTEKSRGFKPSMDQLLVCPGANVAVYYALACALDPGDEVIVPDPGFVSYFSILKFLGLKIKRVPLLEKNEFRLDPWDVKASIMPATRMIIINSPSNPTGAVMTPAEIQDVYGLAKREGLYLLTDEMYSRMIYDGTVFASPSMYDQCKERVILVNGFSKSYAMTGFRLGIVTGPAPLIEKMGLMLETTVSCVSPFIQRAGIEALRGDQKPTFTMVKEYEERRDLIVEGLNTLKGIKCLMPRGAFYVFPNITGTGMTSQKFCDLMLEKAGVSIVPGPVFGKYGEGYVRFCYCNSIARICEAIMRMRQVL